MNSSARRRTMTMCEVWRRVHTRGGEVEGFPATANQRRMHANGTTPSRCLRKPLAREAAMQLGWTQDGQGASHGVPIVARWPLAQPALPKNKAKPGLSKPHTLVAVTSAHKRYNSRRARAHWSQLQLILRHLDQEGRQPTDLLRRHFARLSSSCSFENTSDFLVTDHVIALAYPAGCLGTGKGCKMKQGIVLRRTGLFGHPMPVCCHPNAP